MNTMGAIITMIFCLYHDSLSITLLYHESKSMGDVNTIESMSILCVLVNSKRNLKVQEVAKGL